MLRIRTSIFSLPLFGFLAYQSSIALTFSIYLDIFVQGFLSIDWIYSGNSLFKTALSEEQQFSDVLNFNYKFRDINSKTEHTKQYEAIKKGTNVYQNANGLTIQYQS